MDSKIKAINEELLRGEPENVQKKKALSAKGRDIYGYIPQHIFNAVNKIVGPANFCSEVKDLKIMEKQVVALVRVGIRFGYDKNGNADEWVYHEQAGEMQIILNDIGSAVKGAITDGAEKSLSQFSIGERAYRGKLDPSKQSSKEKFAKMESEVKTLKDKSQARRYYKQHVKEIKSLEPDIRAKIVGILSSIGGQDASQDK